MLHHDTTETVDFESQLTKELYEAYNLKSFTINNHRSIYVLVSFKFKNIKQYDFPSIYKSFY
jgi:hypothetical protein